MTDVVGLLEGEAESLLEYRCTGITKDSLYLPGADFVDRVVAEGDRSVPVMRAMQTLFNEGRLGGTGYVSILPVDQVLTRHLAQVFSSALVHSPL